MGGERVVGDSGRASEEAIALVEGSGDGGERELWRSGMTSLSDLRWADPGGAGDDAGRRWNFPVSGAAGGV